MDRTTCSSSCIKLYLCSNPQDSVVERRALRENVFPKIREHCRHTQGLDLRVIDPFESSDHSHWPDEKTRHQLIEECRESSAGPFLLALIGHQYGTASLPAQVEVSEYQLLLQESQQMGVSTQELEREYQRDENTIPPSYCLRTAHTCSPQPHFKEQEETEIKAKEEELRKVIQTTVSRCVENSHMTPERAQSYYRSALDTDLRFALENRPDGDIIGRCLVYIHRVINAKGQRLMKSENRLLLETPTSKPGTAPSDEQLLSELCDIFLPELIRSSQLLVYTTTTECDRRHGYTTARRRSYAESLCQQVNADFLGLIDSTKLFETSEDFLQCDALSREQAEQEELCDTMSRLYDITRQETEKVRAYVEESKPQHPLVVTGGPCTGKTVLLAHCAQNIKAWLPDSDPMVIIHFCNLSTNISPKHLLSSLCYQIAAKYKDRYSEPNRDPRDSSCDQNLDFMSPHHESTPEEQTCDQDLSTSACLDLYGIITPDICLSDLKRRFLSLVSLMPSTKQPLILILVGLDRIENNFGLEFIKSLLQPVHPRTKIIFSISLNSTQILHARSPSLSTPEHDEKESGYVCVKLGSVDRKECSKMLTSLLTSSGRRVTSGQQVLVNQALVSCCLMLHTRLLREHTSLWHSDSDVTESSLPDSVHSSISALLDHLEEKHGRPIVAGALSYLTLSRTGLTEAELADLLSCDDTVQSVYTQQHSSLYPGEVLQIDLERLLLDLKKFLLRRTVAGSKVLFWVSRHFKLVVARKYVWSPELRREIHLVMVDYFGGQWFCGNSKEMTFKQKTDTNKIGSSLDKQQTSQPFIFSSGQVNLRKVLELPHHLQESNKWEELESLLLSLGFHQAMIQAGLLRDLVTMLENEQASHHFYFSKERAILASVLKLNACLLQSSPLQLATLMESSLAPYLEVFPALKCYVTEIREDRKENGSGLDVVLCPAPSSVPSVHCSKFDAITEGVSITEAAGTECGVVVGVTDDGTAWVWKGAGCEVVKLSMRSEQEDVNFTGVRSSGQFVLLLTSCRKLFFWDVTGSQVFLSVKNPLTTTTAGHQKTNNLKGFVASQRKLFMWWEEEHFVSVFDISNDTLTHFQCQGFVTCLVCSSDGVYMYCGQEGGEVSIFDTTNSRLLGTCSNTKNNTLVSIILCEAKMEFACVDRTGSVTLWGLAAKFESPKLIKEVLNEGEPNIILNTDYSDRHNTLLVCHSQQVTLWDTCDWELWDQFKAPQGRAFTQALLSQDSHLFLALLEDCPLVLVWRVSTGDCVLSLETNKQPHFLLRTASDVVCVSDNCCLTTWDSVMIEAAGTLPKMSFAVEEVATGGTMEFFYTTDGSEVLWKWRSKTKLPHAYFFHDNPVQKLRLSPDDAHLVTLSGGEIYIWQTETGQNILRIRGSRAADILITPNSLLGVSISDSYLSRVWKLSHGSIVCSINLYLSEAQVSPENTFLIGLHHGDLLAASLWTGSISKRFSCVMSSEHVIAFSTLSEHPDFVVVMTTSGAVYTWKVAEETVCSHFQLPNTFHCQPQDFQMSTDGSYALLSTENEVLNLLDLSQVRLCSVKAEGPVIKACLDETGSYVVYISHPRSQEKSCVCSLHVKPVLTVVRLVDGEKVGSVFLQKMPSFLAVFKRQFAFVGFEDGSVGVYSICDVIINEGFTTPFGCRENVKGSVKQCPFNRAPFSWLPLATPNIKWT